MAAGAPLASRAACRPLKPWPVSGASSHSAHSPQLPLTAGGTSVCPRKASLLTPSPRDKAPPVRISELPSQPSPPLASLALPALTLVLFSSHWCCLSSGPCPFLLNRTGSSLTALTSPPSSIHSPHGCQGSMKTTSPLPRAGDSLVAQVLQPHLTLQRHLPHLPFVPQPG